jgi:adenine phosphoribosyltransferase
VCELADKLGAQVVGCVFLVELGFLGGRQRLEPYPVHSLIRY